MSNFASFLQRVVKFSYYNPLDITIIFSIPYPIYFLLTNTSCEHCFTLQVLKTKLQIHTLHALGGLKTLFLSSRETNGWRVPRLGWWDFLQFWALKKQFLPIRETYVSSVPSFVWAHFLLFEVLICDFCRIVIPTVQGYLDSCELIFCTLAAWKSYFCRLVKRMVQGYIFFV